MHTANHILQMSTVQLQEFRFYKLIGIILSCNPDCCTLYAYNLTDNLKKLLIQSLVLPVIVLHVMLIFDVILNQFYVCIDIIHQINPFFRLTLITRLIDRIGITYISITLISLIIVSINRVCFMNFCKFTF